MLYAVQACSKKQSLDWSLKFLTVLQITKWEALVCKKHLTGFRSFPCLEVMFPLKIQGCIFLTKLKSHLELSCSLLHHANLFMWRRFDYAHGRKTYHLFAVICKLPFFSVLPIIGWIWSTYLFCYSPHFLLFHSDKLRKLNRESLVVTEGLGWCFAIQALNYYSSVLSYFACSLTTSVFLHQRRYRSTCRYLFQHLSNIYCWHLHQPIVRIAAWVCHYDF